MFSAKQREAIAAWLRDLGKSPEWCHDNEQIDHAIQQILND
jgi:hypothetical protein